MYTYICPHEAGVGAKGTDRNSDHKGEIPKVVHALYFDGSSDLAKASPNLG
jgi:hypothetical protein